MLPLIVGSTLKTSPRFYVPTAVVVFGASLLISTSLALSGSANADVAVIGTTMTANETARQHVDQETMQYLSGLTVGISVFIALFLTFSTISQSVEGRRTSFSLLRLNGATPMQIMRLVLLESGVIACAAGLLGALLGPALLLNLYLSLLSGAGLEGVILGDYSLSSTVVGTVVFLLVTTLLGAFLPARRMSRVSPIEAAQPIELEAKGMTPFRWVVFAIFAVLSGALLLSPQDFGDGQVISFILAASASISIIAIVPFLIPVLGRLVGRIFRFAPGAGHIVATDRIGFETRQTAAVSTPIILFVGLISVLFMQAQTGRVAAQWQFANSVNSDIVVTGNNVSGNDLIAATKELHSESKTTMVLPVLINNNWGYHESDPTSFPSIGWTDFKEIEESGQIKVLEGSLENLSDNLVATTRADIPVGSTVKVESETGTIVELQIGAKIAPSFLLGGTFIGDVNYFNPDLINGRMQLYISGIDITSAKELIHSSIHVSSDLRVEPSSKWLTRETAEAQQSQVPGLLLMSGGASTLALLSIGQTLISVILGRRQENNRLMALGASKHSLAAIEILQLLITMILSTLAASVIIAACYIRLNGHLISDNIQMHPTIPATVITWLLGAIFFIGSALCVITVYLSASSRKSGIYAR